MNCCCSGFAPWQAMQRLVICSGFTPSKVNILVLSPPAATCAAPGPWHDSQPWVGVPQTFFDVSVAKWGLDSMLLPSASWQPWQTSDPTYCEGSAAWAVVCSAVTFFFASESRRAAITVKAVKRRTPIIIAHRKTGLHLSFILNSYTAGVNRSVAYHHPKVAGETVILLFGRDMESSGKDAFEFRRVLN